MELRQLKYFLGIAETGRFSEASKQCFITQSAVSQQIKALEEELGMQLFVRDTHNVKLTEAGKELLPYARNVINGVAACHDRIADLKGLLCGELNIGMTFTLEPYVRRAMLDFMKAYPKVQVNAHYRNLSQLLQMIKHNEIDMMLSMMPTSPHEYLDSVRVSQYRLAAIMRKGHALANRTVLTFSDLQHQQFILPERGLRDRNAIESFIHAETGDLRIQALVNDVNAILNLLQESDCVSVLAEDVVNSRPWLCAIPIDELRSPIRVYAHFNHTASKKHSAEVFLDMLRRVADCDMNLKETTPSQLFIG